MVLVKRGKGRKALNWSLFLGQMEFGVDEQVKTFTKFMYIFCGLCHSFLSLLASRLQGCSCLLKLLEWKEEYCGEVD